MIEFLLELFGELLLQVGVELLAEFGLRPFAEPFRRQPRPAVAALGYALFGAGAGALSLLVFPSYFVAGEGARIANLVATPLLAGLAMSALGAWRARRGEPLLRIDRFAYGYLFALALALVRFRFAQ